MLLLLNTTRKTSGPTLLMLFTHDLRTPKHEGRNRNVRSGTLVPDVFWSAVSCTFGEP